MQVDYKGEGQPIDTNFTEEKLIPHKKVVQEDPPNEVDLAEFLRNVSSRRVLFLAAYAYAKTGNLFFF